MHIGIDISPFNNLIGNVKVNTHNIEMLTNVIHDITIKLHQFICESGISAFQDELD
jgi:hypothetical protein